MVATEDNTIHWEAHSKAKLLKLSIHIYIYLKVFASTLSLVYSGVGMYKEIMSPSWNKCLRTKYCIVMI
jgi:hypothetical protein